MLSNQPWIITLKKAPLVIWIIPTSTWRQHNITFVRVTHSQLQNCQYGANTERSGDSKNIWTQFVWHRMCFLFYLFSLPDFSGWPENWSSASSRCSSRPAASHTHACTHNFQLATFFWSIFGLNEKYSSTLVPKCYQISVKWSTNKSQIKLEQVTELWNDALFCICSI